jgi:hypothetical protein
MKKPTLFAAALAAIILTHFSDAQVPQLINYTGRVAVGTVNFDGSGQFKFALVDGTATTTFWSNDGTSVAGSEPTAAVTLAVAKGLYSVLLGNASNVATASALSGDVTVNSSGVTAIGAAKVTPAMLNGAQSGVAPIYGCRAWVNFDGTRDSTGAASTANTNRFIRSAGNVTSVMRNGLGNYTVNFVAATPMPDALYAVTFGGQRVDNIGGNEPSPQLSFSDATTSSLKVGAQDNNNDNYADAKAVCVAVFR